MPCSTTSCRTTETAPALCRSTGSLFRPRPPRRRAALAQAAPPPAPLEPAPEAEARPGPEPPASSEDEAGTENQSNGKGVGAVSRRPAARRGARHRPGLGDRHGQRWPDHPGRRARLHRPSRGWCHPTTGEVMPEPQRAGGAVTTRPDGRGLVARGPAPRPPQRPTRPSPASVTRSCLSLNIRRLTAEHMVRSKATSAHTLVVIEADYEGIERVRKAHKDRFREEEGIGLTYLVFVARAVAETLPRLPAAERTPSVTTRSSFIVTSTSASRSTWVSAGSIVPVVRHAEGQSLRAALPVPWPISPIGPARGGSRPTRSWAGPSRITNPGPFGTFLTAPIINQPQVAILSTDGIKRRPVVITAPDGTEAVGIHSVGLLALAFDHRAVDGAYASAFLHELARVIESRDWKPSFERLRPGAACPLARALSATGTPMSCSGRSTKRARWSTCSCSSTRMCTPSACGRASNTSSSIRSRSARSSCTPTGVGTSPTTGPASLSATPSSTSRWACACCAGPRARPRAARHRGRR